MGLKSPCVLTFINEFETANPDILIIKIQFLVRVYWMTNVNTLPDIGGGNFKNIPLKTDGGIIVDDPLIPGKKYFIQFRLGRPGDIGMADRPVVTVNGTFVYAGM